MSAKLGQLQFSAVFPPLNKGLGKSVYKRQEFLRVFEEKPWLKQSVGENMIVPFERLSPVTSAAYCQLAAVEAYDRDGYRFEGTAYPYHFFLREHLPSAVHRNPSLWRTGMMKHLTKRWNALKPKDRERYFALAEEYNKL